MSAKRQATRQLNHENWDQDDPSEHEEMGTFKTASKEVLEKRVIRTAKRRSTEVTKGVFSAFGGFNKPAPSSFDFLANLTNGSKTNGSPANKSDTTVSSSLFGTTTPESGGMFKIPVSTSPINKSTFGMPTSQTSPKFGGPSATPFTASKADSTVADSPFKIPTASSSIDTNQTESSPKSTTANSNTPPRVTSTMFGIAPGNTSTNKSLFSGTTSNSTPFKIQAASGSTGQTSFGVTKSTSNESNNPDEKSDDNKLKYYSKLKGLNESVSDWIKKHVEETPLCILSPIFKDYEKYLKEIQDEYRGGKEESTKPSENSLNDTKTSPTQISKSVTGFSSTNSGSSLFSSTNSPKSKTSLFGGTNSTAPTAEKTSGFSFGINTTTTNPATSTTMSSTTTSGGFSFGIKTQPIPTTTSASLSLTTTNTNTNAAPFSFGLGKPFSFSSNVQKPVEQKTDANTNDEEDEPPKVEFTLVVEENTVFDKRCKIFVKKDGIFVDNGVATMYIKKIEESGKHQLLVRANTNLGNILLNLILTSSIPTQRLGKNNVMMVCIPTPDAKPPPTPILIRVKTSEEADELLETLNKYKG